jgi:endo-1,4-beta-xylanase
MKRRHLLQLGGSLVAASVADRVWADEGLPSLGAAAGRAGIRYGSSSDVAFADAPAEYPVLFARECRLYAPLLSWGYVCGTDRACDPMRRDPNIEFAVQHGMSLTGAHLLWHENVPPWFAGLTRVEARQAASQHIADMLQRYAGTTFAWNVVNEAIEPNDGEPDGMRRSVLSRQLGDDYFDQAFRDARAADQKCLLAYNDYGMEAADATAEARRNALLRLLDRFAAARTPIDAVGLQSHLKIDARGFDQTRYCRFLETIASHKLQILISELDVFDVSTAADPVARDQDIADAYGAFLDVALDQPAVSAVVNWGLSDRYTWLTPKYSASFVRPDGLPSRPLPFDRDFQPKPAFRRMLAAFEKAPKR